MRSCDLDHGSWFRVQLPTAQRALPLCLTLAEGFLTQGLAVPARRAELAREGVPDDDQRSATPMAASAISADRRLEAPYSPLQGTHSRSSHFTTMFVGSPHVSQ